MFGSSAIGLSGSWIRLNFNPPPYFFLLKGDSISGWMSLLIPLIPTVAGLVTTWSGLTSTLFIFGDSTFLSSKTTNPDDSPTWASLSFGASTTGSGFASSTTTGAGSSRFGGASSLTSAFGYSSCETICTGSSFFYSTTGSSFFSSTTATGKTSSILTSITDLCVVSFSG